jgi:uncharacterized repeat protein (TIGR03803 family)
VDGVIGGGLNVLRIALLAVGSLAIAQQGAGAASFGSRLHGASRFGNASGSQTARHYSVLYTFGTVLGDGQAPNGQLIADAQGTLYGSTRLGGAANHGSVFNLRTTGHGVTESVLYNFKGGADGGEPLAGLLPGPNGVFFGTASGGGIRIKLCGYDHVGCGVVYELVPSGGKYKERVIYTFSGPDGAHPVAELIADSAGRLFGTTRQGGAGYGVVFQLTPAGGQYVESILYAFRGIGDGANPASRLTVDAQGNLIGTTENGGIMCYGLGGCGLVYKIVHQGSSYQEQVLYTFTGFDGDGAHPGGGLALDNSGNLFGAAFEGGSYSCRAGCGTIYELASNGSAYSSRTVYDFASGNGDATNPAAALTFTSKESLLGTGETGGAYGYGALFELDPKPRLSVESVLHSFAGGTDGAYPASELFRLGNDYYGTTTQGGSAYCGSGCGTIFELTP